MLLEVADGLEYAFDIQGQAANPGRTALLLHGFTGSGAQWQGFSHELVPSWRVILPDLLGHGASSAPADIALYRMEAAAGHLALLLDQQAGEPVHLLGYSMGGRLALYVALAYPERVRSLVLESASPGLITEAERTARRAADEALADRILVQGMQAFVRDWEALPLFASQSSLPAEVKLQQHNLRLANRSVGLAGSLRGMGTGAQPSLWDRLGALTCPVLLVVGERDARFSAINQRMLERIPNVALAVIPDAGHAPHLEQPAWFSQQVCEFWAQLPVDTDQPHP